MQRKKPYFSGVVGCMELGVWITEVGAGVPGGDGAPLESESSEKAS
jgi:hypothetical protein